MAVDVLTCLPSASACTFTLLYAQRTLFQTCSFDSSVCNSVVS